jgi:uncharacterized protein (DUF488 family)
MHVWTLGHSTRTIDEFISLLAEHAIELLVDVRAIPKSKRLPHFAGDQLAHSLEAAGVRYEHMSALGGRRHHRKGAPPSPNSYWRVEAFRNYADYAETPEFTRAIDALMARSSARRTAIMCAEAVWWRCHRRIIADYLIARGVEVVHIMAPAKAEPAALTPGAQILPDRTIRYVKEPQLFVE